MPAGLWCSVTGATKNNEKRKREGWAEKGTRKEKHKAEWGQSECVWERQGAAKDMPALWAATPRDVALRGSPAAVAVLSPRSLVWLPGMTWRSVFSGDWGRLWARVARSALRYCSRVTWRTESIPRQVQLTKPGGESKVQEGHIVSLLPISTRTRWEHHIRQDQEKKKSFKPAKGRDEQSSSVFKISKGSWVHSPGDGTRLPEVRGTSWSQGRLSLRASNKVLLWQVSERLKQNLLLIHTNL